MLIYTIQFTPHAEKELSKLGKEIQEHIRTNLQRIILRPFSFVKKLKGREEYSYRVGDYRLLLLLKDTELIILVIEIGHRKNVYD